MVRGSRFFRNTSSAQTVCFTRRYLWWREERFFGSYRTFLSFPSPTQDDTQVFFLLNCKKIDFVYRSYPHYNERDRLLIEIKPIFIHRRCVYAPLRAKHCVFQRRKQNNRFTSIIRLTWKTFVVYVTLGYWKYVWFLQLGDVTLF